jgi:hypothetical protein
LALFFVSISCVLKVVGRRLGGEKKIHELIFP